MTPPALPRPVGYYWVRFGGVSPTWTIGLYDGTPDLPWGILGNIALFAEGQLEVGLPVQVPAGYVANFDHF